MSPIPEGAIQLENSEVILLFDEETHMLASIKDKITGIKEDIEIFFAAYPTAQFRSGEHSLICINIITLIVLIHI